MVRSPSLDNVGASLVYRIGSTATYKKLFRYRYPLMTKRLNQHDDVQFLNWGYEEDPPLGLPLDPADEPNRYSIQLYHQTATQDGVDLAGKGAGVQLRPRRWRLVPVPHVEAGLLHRSRFQRGRSRILQGAAQVLGLDFVHGDAENLPFRTNPSTR